MNDGVSTGSSAATVNVSGLNDAPTVVNGATTTLAAIGEDATNPAGDTVTNLFGGHFSDPDQVAGSFAGIAVTANAAAAAQGAWQWSTDGVTWTAIATTVSDANALVLAAATQLRFLPAADVNGTVPSLTAHLVDTSGTPLANNTILNLSGAGATGGTTQYSTGTVALSQAITAVNDAPVALTGGPLSLPTIKQNDVPPGVTVASVFGPEFSDARDNQTASGGSSANNLAGIAVVGNAAAAAQGAWQWFDGVNWNSFIGASPSNAITLSASAQIRFLPAVGFNGQAPSLTTRLVDDSGGALMSGTVVDLGGIGATGGTTRYSATTVPVTETVRNLLSFGADFDGDGKSDILWRDAAGHTSLWLMDGGQIKPGGAFDFGTIGPSWRSFTGDFDGDGKSDILWRTDAGQTSIWEMNGGQIKQAFDLGGDQPRRGLERRGGARLRRRRQGATSCGATPPGTPACGRWTAARSSRAGPATSARSARTGRWRHGRLRRRRQGRHPVAHRRRADRDVGDERRPDQAGAGPAAISPGAGWNGGAARGLRRGRQDATSCGATTPGRRRCG